jgi:hypothetical protein
MNPLATYIIGSSLVGWVTGSIHGTFVHTGRPELILMSGLQGMVMGPYAPIIIPYMVLSDDKSKCPIFRK